MFGDATEEARGGNEWGHGSFHHRPWAACAQVKLDPDGHLRGAREAVSRAEHEG